ncbi:MAG: precorrin-4 C(11)-methyltransferase [Nitrospiraceae bacterium]
MSEARRRRHQFREPVAVSFIGAGPGAPDLLTIRGRQRLAQADAILYADSLIHPALLRFAKPGTEVRGTASLHLEAIVDLMIDAVRAGRRVARLHSGDPSLYGAINEQMERLDEAGIPYEVIPGVSAFSAAAAALGVELTRPAVAQTVILTRCAGRTGMPEGEALQDLARHGTTLILYLSIAHLPSVLRDLRAGGYADETPAAVVYRVTWDDERIVRATLATIAQEVRAAKISRQALILVGAVLAERCGSSTRSKLYDPGFSHLFRRPMKRSG